MIYVGIDPGLDGALVALAKSEATGALEPFYSSIAPTEKKAGKREYIVSYMAMMIRDLEASPGIVLACLEKGGARPKQGVTSMISIGYGIGLWTMALGYAQVPYEKPTPQAWMKVMLAGIPGEGKERAIIACDRLLPGLNLRPGKRTKAHSGLADAGMLAVFAYRRCQGQA